MKVKVSSIDDVIEVVKKIKECSGDDEAAHCLEDDLRFEVLCYIAQFSTEDKIRKMALEAIQTESIDFARWCA